MESSMELLKGPPQVTERQISVSSSTTSTKSLGKPIEKPYYTVQDVCMIILSLLCLLIGILAVANKPFAAYLGEKNQLILVGLLLSLMAACTQKQVQLFLITFETRFGASTLQNYDSILRYSMLDANAGFLLKAAIVFIFALPLALSASYKQFVSGSTVLTVDPTTVSFGPVGPPGLVEGVLSVWLNASLPFLIPNRTAYQIDPLLRQADQSTKTGSFGFNSQIISENKTALLDAPIAYEIDRLQNLIKTDEILEISTYVNATICDLNSTNKSPERANPNYWRTLNQSITPPTIASYGTGLNFAVSSGEHDYSFVIMSLWDTQNHETFESEAVGFNLYRGQCNATWQINHEGTITLKDASNCTKRPDFSRPCMKNIVPKGFNATTLRGEDALQLPLTCNSEGPSSIAVWPLYDLLWLQPVLPVWVAAVAAMAWAEIAYFDGPAIWASTFPINESAWDTAAPFPFLKYQAPVNLKKTVQTLHRDHGALYFVLMVQPILLLASFLGRFLLFSTPVSSGFGLVTLLAGVSRDSLDVLRGAAFSGTLRKPVRIRISTVDRDGNGMHENSETSIEYEIDAPGRHDEVARRKIYS